MIDIDVLEITRQVGAVSSAVAPNSGACRMPAVEESVKPPG
jgi:hypothetical protein